MNRHRAPIRIMAILPSRILDMYSSWHSITHVRGESYSNIWTEAYTILYFVCINNIADNQYDTKMWGRSDTHDTKEEMRELLSRPGYINLCST